MVVVVTTTRPFAGLPGAPQLRGGGIVGGDVGRGVTIPTESVLNLITYQTGHTCVCDCTLTMTDGRAGAPLPVGLTSEHRTTH